MIKILLAIIINDDSELANLVAEIYSKSDCRYGYRKVHAELIDIGFKINKKKVQKLMKELCLNLLSGIMMKDDINLLITKDLLIFIMQ